MFVFNTSPAYGRALTDDDLSLLGPQGAAEARRVLAWRGGDPTPLVELPGLAHALGVGAIVIKDEGQRLGLGSFKALGGGYAVLQLLRQSASKALGRPVDLADLNDDDVRALAANTVFACATDGNHGRSVAQGARMIGARSVIFMHRGVSDDRAQAIARFGAEIVRVDGTYDDSIEEAARVSAANGWTVVSDTSWDGYETIPGLVMQGYTVMVDEALEVLTEPPTHVFMQAGVGGLAAAVAGRLATALGDQRPMFVVVEPSLAACVLETARAGRPTRAPHTRSTVMAMLECQDASPLAWRTLERVADAFLTVEDDEAVAVMNRLARPLAGDPAVVAGESGGVGLAGLMRAMSDPTIKAALKLDETSRVFLINSEGATDPKVYGDLVGLAPEAVGQVMRDAFTL